MQNIYRESITINNPHDKGIAVSVVITSLVPDNLYEIEYIGLAGET